MNNETTPLNIVARLPTIRNVIQESKVTHPATDFFEDELLITTIQDIKQHMKEENKRTKLIKTHLYSNPYKEVPISYKKWWKKDDIKKLYKGLMKYGYDISFIEKYMDYKWTRDQIRRRLKYENQIRPHLIEKAMLFNKQTIMNSK